jgi:hypothetical protein
MLDLHNFLESNKKYIFNFVEYNQRPIQIGAPLFEKLMNKFKDDWPMSHGNYDKTHYELAIAIVESLWIGCLSQMKENRLLANDARTAYPKGTTDNLKQVIIDAFDVGRNYAPQEEARRQQA